MRRRDLVVVGTSAGGVEALPTLFAQLPAETPAAFAVVQHLPSGSSRHLVAIIRRATPMIVKWAEDAEPVVPGIVYVAPSDLHLELEDECVRLVPGPPENHARPAINRLFRSAAASYGDRTVGILMTGMLNDGADGLTTIQRAGGITIVQDPRDARYPDMPTAALKDMMKPEHVVPIASMGALLFRLTSDHTAVLAGRTEETDRSLWAAVRALQERATTLADLARGAREQGNELVTELYERQAREACDHAERARTFLLEDHAASPTTPRS